MTNINIVVRNVPKELYQRFKSTAWKRGTTVGRAFTNAIKLWMHVEEKPIKGSLLDLKPVHLGKDTRYLSIDIDKILYGGK